jgi:hypothetical protein
MGKNIPISTEGNGKSESPLQTEFKFLMGRLKKGEADLADLTKTLDKKLNDFNTNSQPVYTSWCRVKLDIAFCLFEHLINKQRGQEQKMQLNQFIQDIVSNILHSPHGMNNEEVNKLNDLSRDLEDFGIMSMNDLSEDDLMLVTDMKEAMLDDLLDTLRVHFRKQGLEVDLDNIDASLSKSELRKVIEERLSRARSIADKKKERASKKKKEKTEDDKSSAASELEALKKKGLSEIYKRLAKLIHPDMEKDPQRQELKLEWMKKLTVACDEGDLNMMLKIEAEWAADMTNHSDELSEEKLKAYIALLKDQLKTQAKEKNEIFTNPKYYSISFFAQGPLMLTVSSRDINYYIQEKENQDRGLLYTIQANDKAAERAVAGLIV